MATLLLNYTFDDPSYANPDGTAPGTFTGTSQVPGPGRSTLGNLPRALQLGSAGKTSVSLASVATNARQFCVRIAFKVTSPVTKRQNLAESTKLPFSMSVRENGSANSFDLTANVGSKHHGWTGCSTAHKKAMQVGQWYSASLVYDLDTLALFVDNQLVDIHAFPEGQIDQKSDGHLFLGTWVDGRRDKFDGQLAGFQLYHEIPTALESQLDANRDSPAWYITHKYESIKAQVRPGKLTRRPVVTNATGTLYYYEGCAIGYHSDAGAAFEMHGSIYTTYQGMRNSAALGFLVSDEHDGTARGTKKSLFRHGAIYWSSATGAVPVLDKIYLEYENQGASGTWGLPTGVVRREGNGSVQQFQKCCFYHEDGQPRAFEVHGAILDRYLGLGGPPKFGFPVSDETDVHANSSVVGKTSEFTGCVIYWSRTTGAHEVYGAIRQAYETECGGPIGEMGFPTSGEVAIPGLPAGPRMNTFQRGSILLYSKEEAVTVVRPFELFIKRIETRESEGVGMGQNDLHFYATIDHNGTRLHHSRHPGSGDYGNNNHKTVNVRLPNLLVPNGVRDTFQLTFDVRDSDPGDDDHLGKKTFIFNAANAWGMRPKQGVYSEAFSRVTKLTFAVQPRVPAASLSEVQKFWGIKNQKTPTLTYEQFASMFRDVDSEMERLDPFDQLRNLYYKHVVKTSAANGNCFGFSLEAIESRKCRSPFSLPLDRFSRWEDIKNEINIKHGYQLGAESIWWTVGQFLSGNTHDPIDVFNRSRAAFERGENPILGISADYFYQEGGHAILPVAWHRSGNKGTIDILDSNMPRKISTLHVDFSKNEYFYKGAKRDYAGGQWAGGRLVYFPYCLYNRVPRTPMWEAIMIMLAGGFLILGDDATTERIEDSQGRDLLATGERAKGDLQRKASVKEYFVPIQATDGNGPAAGQFLARTEDGLANTDFTHTVKGLRQGGKLEYFMQKQLRQLRVSTAIGASESNVIVYQRGGSPQSVLSFGSPQTKPVAIEYRNRLGANGDYFKVSLPQVQVVGNKALEINIKPSFGGLEISPQGENGTVPILIETMINKRIARKTLQVDLRQPARIMPISIGGTPQIGVSRIDTLFGPKLDLDIR